LLVVVAVIAILAAMLLPVLSRAREQARRAVCLTNLKQIVLAVTMYSNDYDEWYPPFVAHSWTPASCYLFENSAASRATLVPAYLKAGPVFFCPSGWLKWTVYKAGWLGGTSDSFTGYTVLFGDMNNVDSPYTRFRQTDVYGNPQNLSSYALDTASYPYGLAGGNRLVFGAGRYPVLTNRNMTDAATRVLIADIYYYDSGAGASTASHLGKNGQPEGINCGFADGSARWKVIGGEIPRLTSGHPKKFYMGNSYFYW